MAWLQSTVRAEHDVFSTSAQVVATASLAIRAPAGGYWFRYRFDQSLSSVTHSFRTADEGLDFSVRFSVFPQREPGSYTDTLSVSICYDEACSREVQGSPFTMPLRLDVGYFARAEQGVTPVVPVQTTVLDHDVVGVAYSAALDAVITASALPEPMLRVHDLRSGLVRSHALLTAPTSLSVGADGLHAAVGHDAAVSLVDLQAGPASAVSRMQVPMAVGSVVLAGARIVAIGAQAFNWNDIYWVDTATGVATRAGSGKVFGIGDSVLHPSGDRIYFADRGVSPDDVIRMDLDGDPAAAQTHDSRYHGDYAFCSRVAISPDGRRLYTGCGVVLSTATLLEDDMRYAGQMALSPADAATLQPYVSTALSVAPDGAHVALLEENRYTCNPQIDRLDDCHTRVAVYDAATLARRSLLGLAPYQRGSDSLKQWGRRVMHRSDGSLIVMAEVRTRNEATPTWLLHRLNP
ncbi:MAG TPA: hypothetical protein VFQ16_12640 [Burkholderiaceae bacterium]|nr:hypothetical protein [Burkholderiaceae bacterium]